MEVFNGVERVVQLIWGWKGVWWFEVVGREGLSRRKLGMKMLQVENNMGEF